MLRTSLGVSISMDFHYVILKSSGNPPNINHKFIEI